MRILQLIIAVITALMMLGMFGMSIWVKANFSKGVSIPECYMPISIITTVLVLVTIIIIFVRR